jgi:hypothetical protein
MANKAHLFRSFSPVKITTQSGNTLEDVAANNLVTPPNADNSTSPSGSSFSHYGINSRYVPLQFEISCGGVSFMFVS